MPLRHYADEELVEQYDYLARHLQRLADEMKEPVLVCPPGFPKSDSTSGVPYGVLQSVAAPWEKENAVRVVVPSGYIGKTE